MGYGRAQTVFRSMMNEIGKRKTLPGPAAYQLPETIRSRRFTLKARQPNEIDLKTKQMVPGPGQYSIPSLNPEGRYTISTHKNVRFIIMDGERSSPELKRPPIGPGSCIALTIIDELTSQDDISSQEKINLMRVRPRKTFGVSVRPSPAERTKLFVPGPGMYDTFSEFGEPELSNPSDSKYGRMKTQY